VASFRACEKKASLRAFYLVRYWHSHCVGKKAWSEHSEVDHSGSGSCGELSEEMENLKVLQRDRLRNWRGALGIAGLR
jgi:hypothetical protein